MITTPLVPCSIRKCRTGLTILGCSQAVTSIATPAWSSSAHATTTRRWGGRRSRTRWQAAWGSPDTLNRYLYAKDDPVNVVDPSGKFYLDINYDYITGPFDIRIPISVFHPEQKEGSVVILAMLLRVNHDSCKIKAEASPSQSTSEWLGSYFFPNVNLNEPRPPFPGGGPYISTVFAFFTAYIVIRQKSIYPTAQPKARRRITPRSTNHSPRRNE